MKMKFYICIFLFIFFSSCETPLVSSLDKDGIYIRVENTSDYNIENLTFGDKTFRKIKPGKFSEYHKFEYVHLEGYTIYNSSAKINGNLIIGPMSFCGTSTRSLEGGSYDAKLELIERNGEPKYYELTIE
jgi:hypothetical protein